MNKKVVIIGAGGHAKVVADIILKSNDILVGYLDDNIKNENILGKVSDCIQYNDCEFIIGIGNNYTRKNIASTYNLNWYTAIHPNATIALDVTIEEGTVIMSNAVINSSTHIGKHCIINTGSIVEHDNDIHDYVHISPNATLCGTVSIGECTHIGASATVINNKTITKDCMIGAAGLVIKDIDKEGTYVGVPVRKIK